MNVNDLVLGGIYYVGDDTLHSRYVVLITNSWPIKGIWIKLSQTTNPSQVKQVIEDTIAYELFEVFEIPKTDLRYYFDRGYCGKVDDHTMKILNKIS